jgi:hypothetical protein
MSLAMTYNFDPDRWFQIRADALRQRHKLGELSPEQLQAELDKLATEYEEMLKRLDFRTDYPDQSPGR